MEERQIVVFTLGKEEYGIPINVIREIIKTPESTKLPDVPDFVEGIINLRGKVIPIIDLHKRFGLTSIKERSNESRVLVLEIAGQTVGIMVDEVTEVLKLPEEAVENPPKIVAGKQNSILEGVGKLGERLLILLNPNVTLLSPELDEEQFLNLQKNLQKISGDDL